jgi:hypothetical protein
LIFLPAALRRADAHFSAGLAPAKTGLAVVATRVQTPSAATILMILISAILSPSFQAPGSALLGGAVERSMRSAGSSGSMDCTPEAMLNIGARTLAIKFLHI